METSKILNYKNINNHKCYIYPPHKTEICVYISSAITGYQNEVLPLY